MAKKKREILYLLVSTDKFEYIDYLFESVSSLAHFLGVSRAQIFRIMEQQKTFQHHKIEKIDITEKL